MLVTKCAIIAALATLVAYLLSEYFEKEGVVLTKIEHAVVAFLIVWLSCLLVCSAWGNH